MPNFFNTLATLLLNNPKKTIIINSYSNGDFGFTHRGYEGKMAEQKPGDEKFTRKKQGFFDFVVNTGARYSPTPKEPVTHYQLIHDLLANTTLEKCYSIWRGQSPFDIASNLNEEQALLTLSLLMFEQEVNWGKEVWQKHSNFLPSTVPPHKRPRDMIMGFVAMAFSSIIDFNAYPHWNDKNKIPVRRSHKTPATPTFGYDGYARLPLRFKKYFTNLEGINTALPLMNGTQLTTFTTIANSAPFNPTYKSYHNIK